MSYYEPLVYRVSELENGWILKDILLKRMKLSRKLLSRLKLTEKGITVNGDRQYISIRVSHGDIVEVRMIQEVSEDILPQNIPFQSLYEDEHLLIVNKAAGMIVHPTHGHYVNTLANAVVYYWLQQGGQYRFRPIHRLDQDTSGVLAVAKNPFAHQHISQQMIANNVYKEYTAIVHGIPPEGKGTIDAPIDRDPLSPHIRIVIEGGYSAITHYEVEHRYPSASMVRIQLETGRTHQIRVHMKHIGCPLFGDKLYSLAEEPPVIQRQALHAHKLSFIHPITNKLMEFTAEMPEDMLAAISLLET